MALDAVQALVEKSMVVALPGADDAPRFKLLESLRAFALERLDEAGETSFAHLRYLQAMRLQWEQADASAHSEFTLVWLARHTPEIDNLRAALRYAISRAEASDTAMADQALTLVTCSPMLWPRAGLVADGVAACEAVRPYSTSTLTPALQRGFALAEVMLAQYNFTVMPAGAEVLAESLRVFRSCPLIPPKDARSSLQMLAIARAMAALCARAERPWPSPGTNSPQDCWCPGSA